MNVCDSLQLLLQARRHRAQHRQQEQGHRQQPRRFHGPTCTADAAALRQK